MRDELDPVDVALFSATQMRLILDNAHQFVQYYSQRRVCYPDYSSSDFLIDKLDLYDGLQDVMAVANFDLPGIVSLRMPVNIDVICDDVLYLNRCIDDCPDDLKQSVLDAIKIEAMNLFVLYNDGLRFNLHVKHEKDKISKPEASKIKVYTGSGLFSIRPSRPVAIRAFLKTKLKSLASDRAAALWDSKYLAKTNKFYQKMIEYV